MLIRFISGAAGVAVVLFAFTWPNVVPALEEGSASPTMIGFFTAFVVMFGVYLIFYGLTGDWLPRLTKLRDRG
jgi:hypothetical protein